MDDNCFYIVLNVTLSNSMYSKTEYTKTKAILPYPYAGHEINPDFHFAKVQSLFP